MYPQEQDQKNPSTRSEIALESPRVGEKDRFHSGSYENCRGVFHLKKVGRPSLTKSEQFGAFDIFQNGRGKER